MLNHPENNGIHISSIISSTSCEHHDAAQNEGCWYIWVATDQSKSPAVCGRRIRKAGFTGTITPLSLSRFPNANNKPRVRNHPKTTRPGAARRAYND